MNVAFRESYLRDLRAIKDESVLRRIKEVIELVEGAAKPADILNLKKLKGHSQHYRIRIGEHQSRIEDRIRHGYIRKSPKPQGHLQIFPMRLTIERSSSIEE